MYSLQAFMQLTVNGLLFGAMYGISAVGLSLIFGAMKIIFIAQGAVMILAAYSCYWLFILMGIDPFLAIVIVVPIFFLLGSVLYLLMFHRSTKMGSNTSLLVAFGLMMFVQNIMSVLWSPNPKGITSSYTGLAFLIGSVSIPFGRLTVFIACFLATFILFLFLKRTFIGKAVRGASVNAEAAPLLGINVRRINLVGFAMGLTLTGVAGALLSVSYVFDPYYGFTFAIKAMIALAFGGLGSVGSAMTGGIILGLFESTGAFFAGGGWADAFSYIAFLIILLVRPQGLLSRSQG